MMKHELLIVLILNLASIAVSLWMLVLHKNYYIHLKKLLFKPGRQIDENLIDNVLKSIPYLAILFSVLSFATYFFYINSHESLLSQSCYLSNVYFLVVITVAISMGIASERFGNEAFFEILMIFLLYVLLNQVNLHLRIS